MLQIFVLQFRRSLQFYERKSDKWFCLLLHFLQQRYMIAALEEYASLSSEGPEKSDVVKETARYLQACHLIFEKGILSHVFIRSNESAVFKNIQQGWRYFEEWADEHNNTGMYTSKTLFS